MCGIAGILNFSGQPVAHNQIKSMTDSLSHRGPDGEGQWIEENIGLGHRRLAIIDLSPAGRQPMQTSKGRFTITYNGEVYNFKELRAELESLGYQFHSNTDSEVVLNAYAEWKEKCVKRFNGMFAFAIWDKKKKRLFLARDRYGVKPIYYYKNKESFVFASEIKAIIKSGVYRTLLNKFALVEYFTFQNFFTDNTLFQDVRILMPGHYMNIDFSGKIINEEYWDFNFSGNLKITEQEAAEEVDRLFKQSVQRQLISDVPVNSYLSGGIDSSAIAIIASQHLDSMKTFTIGFDLSSASGMELSFDERDKAEHISYLAKTEHYEMVLKAGDMERCMKHYIHHLEEPRVGQSYPNYYAAKLASKFGKVLLSGIGGDELFAGYPWRYFYTNTPKTFNEFQEMYYQSWQRLLPESDLLCLLKYDSPRDHAKHIFYNVFSSLDKDTDKKEDYINESLYLEAKTFLHGLLIVEDKLSMSHGLETRVPFLDNDLVNFTMKLPTNLKINMMNGNKRIDENDLNAKNANLPQSGKTVLRCALSKYLPDKILSARKQGFSAPDASWFKGESIDYVKSKILNRQSRIFNFIDYEHTTSLLKQHFEGNKNMRLFIWSLLCVNETLSQFDISDGLNTYSKSTTPKDSLC